MANKREDLLKKTQQEMQYELDKFRENDMSMSQSFISNTSYQHNVIGELELKIKSL